MGQDSTGMEGAHLRIFSNDYAEIRPPLSAGVYRSFDHGVEG
jgi:hypothetical protein